MNVWGFLATIAMIAGVAYVAVVASAASGALRPGPWAWFRTALPHESDADWRAIHRAALPAAIVGGAGSTTVAAVGGILTGWMPWSAPWTLAALVVLGVGMLVGSLLAKHAAARLAAPAE
jgi:hypothetical protein